MCTKCGDDRCIGSYLLHSKELCKRYEIIRKELLENSNKAFKLIISPSSGEIFTRFYELHVLDNVSDAEAGKLENLINSKPIITDINWVRDASKEQIDKIEKISNLNIMSLTDLFKHGELEENE